MGSGFVRGNYYRNKDTFKKLTHRPILHQAYIIMSQTNTITINGQNWNQISRKGGLGPTKAAEAAAITVTIAETTRSQINIHQRKNERQFDFQINKFKN